MKEQFWLPSRAKVSLTDYHFRTNSPLDKREPLRDDDWLLQANLVSEVWPAFTFRSGAGNPRMVRWLLVLSGAIANGRSTGAKKAWRDIWAAGQDIGAVKDILSIADFVDRIDTEYRAAKALLAV